MSERKYHVTLAVCYHYGWWEPYELHMSMPDNSEQEFTEGEIWEAACDEYKHLHRDPTTAQPYDALGLVDWQRIDEDESQFKES
jgi:hypothetical protein